MPIAESWQAAELRLCEKTIRRRFGSFPSAAERAGLISLSPTNGEGGLLDALQPPEDLHAFVRPLAASRRSFDPEIADAVRAETRGYPFHIQICARRLALALGFGDD